jgi:hypothetical protein
MRRCRIWTLQRRRMASRKLKMINEGKRWMSAMGRRRSLDGHPQHMQDWVCQCVGERMKVQCKVGSLIRSDKINVQPRHYVLQTILESFWRVRKWQLSLSRFSCRLSVVLTSAVRSQQCWGSWHLHRTCRSHQDDDLEA